MWVLEFRNCTSENSTIINNNNIFLVYMNFQGSFVFNPTVTNTLLNHVTCNATIRWQRVSRELELYMRISNSDIEYRKLGTTVNAVKWCTVLVSM